MLFAIISPLIMRSLIDDVLIGKNTALLVPLLAAMAGIFLVSALSNYLSARVKGTLYIDLYREFSSRIFRPSPAGGICIIAEVQDRRPVVTDNRECDDGRPDRDQDHPPDPGD